MCSCASGQHCPCGPCCARTAWRSRPSRTDTTATSRRRSPSSTRPCTTSSSSRSASGRAPCRQQPDPTWSRPPASPDASGPPARGSPTCLPPAPDGYWEGEMVWNSMLLSQWVIVQDRRPAAAIHDTRRHRQAVRGDAHARGRLGHARRGRALRLHDHARLRGAAPARPARRARCARRRSTGSSRSRAACCAIPTWGKFWLAMLGLYDYDGVNPIPPELFLCPIGCRCIRTITIAIRGTSISVSRTSTGVVSTANWGRCATFSVASSMTPNTSTSISRPASHDIAPSDLHVRPSCRCAAATTR